jgi:tripartite-type tricarboxylate transporter receptor subunit TctC
MSLTLRRIVLRAVPALLLAALSLPAHAQSYPNADIHFVTGFPPGSGADVITRFFAEKLRPVAGRTILVENKVGASGAISIEYVARSKPDGYTILFNAGSATAASMHLMKSPPVDVLKAFRSPRPSTGRRSCWWSTPRAPTTASRN